MSKTLTPDLVSTILTIVTKAGGIKLAQLLSKLKEMQKPVAASAIISRDEDSGSFSLAEELNDVLTFAAFQLPGATEDDVRFLLVPAGTSWEVEGLEGDDSDDDGDLTITEESLAEIVAASATSFFVVPDQASGKEVRNAENARQAVSIMHGLVADGIEATAYAGIPIRVQYEFGLDLYAKNAGQDMPDVVQSSEGAAVTVVSDASEAAGGNAADEEEDDDN